MRVTEVTRTRFWSVNLRLRCVRELNNTPSILCALFLPQTKIYPTKILRPPSAYLRDISGAEDEVRYSPFEDDKPERAANTRSEAGSDNFCHPSRKGVEPISLTEANFRIFNRALPYKAIALPRQIANKSIANLLSVRCKQFSRINQ